MDLYWCLLVFAPGARPQERIHWFGNRIDGWMNSRLSEAPDIECVSSWLFWVKMKGTLAIIQGTEIIAKGWRVSAIGKALFLLFVCIRNSLNSLFSLVRYKWSVTLMASLKWLSTRVNIAPCSLYWTQSLLFLRVLSFLVNSTLLHFTVHFRSPNLPHHLLQQPCIVVLHSQLSPVIKLWF